jgi:glutamine amidotransferase
MRSTTPKPRVTIVDSGKANIASVSAALRRAGADPFVANSATEINNAEYLVLPGVGAFGAAMQSWQERDLVQPIRDLINSGVPTLAICLGMQLLCSTSEEAPGVAGLNVIPAAVKSFSTSVRQPHLGWNIVEASDCELQKTGYAYFAHSFRLTTSPGGCRVGRTNYDGSFIASIETKNILACQFHPELSGRWGAELIKAWLDQENGAC